MTKTRTLTTAATLALLAAAAAPVHAGGFATARFGGEHGHPTTDNPTAIYYNPAGLALGTGTRLFIEGMFAYRSASYDRPADAIDNVTDTGVGTPTEALSANSGEATLGEPLASPFLGVVSDLGVPNLGVGVGFYVPIGGQATWNKNEEYEGSELYPGAVDGVQRWATIDGTIRELYISAAAAYRLPGPRVSFGLGLNVVREEINTIRARVATGTDDLVQADGRLVEGRSLIDVSNTTVSIGAGVIWEPIDALWLGASYQSQPGFGTSTQEGTLRNKLGAVATDESDIYLFQAIPDIYRLGARFRPAPNTELRLSGDYQRWSVMQDQCLTSATEGANCALDDEGGNTADSQGVIVNIHRDWNDTFGVRAGGSYWLRPELELAGGLSFDSNAVPDETLDPSLMDMNKVVATLGGRYQVTRRVLLNLSYSHVFYFDRTVDPRPRDAMGEPITPPPPSRVPDFAGTYSQTIGLFNLGAEVLF